jgi:hypothetical protein
MSDPETSHVHSHVSEIEVRQDNGRTETVVNIQLVGFREYDYVQLSGYAAQKNGAFAAISGQQRIGSVDSDGVAMLKVPVTPTKDFAEGQEVTVALWAAQAWLTVLGNDQDVKPPVSRAWKLLYSAPDYGTDGT